MYNVIYSLQQTPLTRLDAKQDYEVKIFFCVLRIILQLRVVLTSRDLIAILKYEILFRPLMNFHLYNLCHGNLLSVDIIV